MRRLTTAAAVSASNASHVYTHGHAQAVVAHHAKRTAKAFAPACLELLRPGDSILDVGCGPGSITRGFRDAVGSSGRGVGLDAEPKVVMEAQALCGDAAEIAVGDVYKLSAFADGSMDVVHAHQVLQHLQNPVAALCEMRRVAKRYVVCRDVVYDSWTWNSPSRGLEDWRRVYRAVARRNQGDPDAGMNLLSYFSRAGMSSVELKPTVVSYAGEAETRALAGTWAQRITETRLAEHAIAQGESTKEKNAAMAAAWIEWGARLFSFAWGLTLVAQRANRTHAPCILT